MTEQAIEPTPLTIADVEAALALASPPEPDPDPFPGDPTATWTYWTDMDTAERGVPAEWVWERLRLRRNAHLAESDVQVTADASGDVDAWLTYRQALRDLPASTPNPTQVTWPEPPTTTQPNVNRVAVKAAALAALADNRTFLALASPSQAQSLAQIKALSRQTNGVIRLLLNKLDGTD